MLLGNCQKEVFFFFLGGGRVANLMEFEFVIEFISLDTCVSYKLNSRKLDAEETISKYWTVNDAGRFRMRACEVFTFFSVFSSVSGGALINRMYLNLFHLMEPQPGRFGWQNQNGTASDGLINRILPNPLQNIVKTSDILQITEK